MSAGQSPIVPIVLYDQFGNPMPVQNGVAIPAGTSGLLAMGKDAAGNARTPFISGVEQSFGHVPTVNQFAVQANATLTASGSTIVTSNFYGAQQITLVVNVTNAPTGTTPTIQFTIQEVDPGNGTTLINSPASTAVITAAGVFQVTLNPTVSGYVQVSWVVTGTTPSFTGVYATLTAKATPGSQAVTSTSAPPTNATSDIAIGKVLTGGAVTNTKVPINRTTYTEQTTNAQRSMSSTSANDTAAGTGARQVKITYFTSDLTTKNTETVTLNGTTAVNTVNTNICFIEKMEVVSVGSNGGNVGTLTLFTGTAGTGTAIGTIAVDTSGTVVGVNNRTYWAHHYVLVGKTCHIVYFDGGTQGNQNAEVFISAFNPTVATSVDEQISSSITVGLNAPTATRLVQNTIQVTGPARLQMYAIPAGNNTNYFASFDFYEM